jgi:hypothetical protein
VEVVKTLAKEVLLALLLFVALSSQSLSGQRVAWKFKNEMAHIYDMSKGKKKFNKIHNDRGLVS